MIIAVGLFMTLITCGGCARWSHLVIDPVCVTQFRLDRKGMSPVHVHRSWIRNDMHDLRFHWKTFAAKSTSINLSPLLSSQKKVQQILQDRSWWLRSPARQVDSHLWIINQDVSQRLPRYIGSGCDLAFFIRSQTFLGWRESQNTGFFQYRKPLKTTIVLQDTTIGGTTTRVLNTGSTSAP